VFGLPTEAVVSQVSAFIAGAHAYIDWLDAPLILAVGLVVLGTVGNIVQRLFRKEG